MGASLRLQSLMQNLCHRQDAMAGGGGEVGMIRGEDITAISAGNAPNMSGF